MGEIAQNQAPTPPLGLLEEIPVLDRWWIGEKRAEQAAPSNEQI